MKKIYKLVLGILVTIIAILIIVPFLFQDKIVGLVKEAVNANLHAKVDFADGSLSLLQNFPSASVSLSDVSVINKEPFEGDTLLFAKEITLKLGLLDLIKSSSGQLHIKSFVVDNGLVNIVSDAKGRVNYDIAKKEATDKVSESTPEETNSNFQLSIENYQINNTNVNYVDTLGKLTTHITDLNHEGSGDFSQDRTELDTQTSGYISITKDKVSYANKVRLSLDAKLDMDLVNKKFSFLKNELKVNNLPLVFNGFVQVNETNQEVQLDFKTPSTDFKSFLGLLPEAYAKDVKNVQTDGKFSVDGKVNGFVDTNQIPKIDIAINAADASFKYPDLPKSVRNININASVKNTTGNPKNTSVNIEKLAFKIDDDSFSGKGRIANVTTNPEIKAHLLGTLNLANIDRAYPVALESDLKGIVKADLHTQFDVKAIENNMVERIKNEGTIEVKDFIYTSKEIANPIAIAKTKINFDPKVIRLTQFQAKTGKSDLSANGTLTNLLGFLLADKNLQGDVQLQSEIFRVSDFMTKSERQEEKSSESKEDTPSNADTYVKIPEFIDCKVTAKVKTVTYDNLTLKNVAGTFRLKDQKAILQNVHGDIFNGKISLDGEVNTQKEKPSFGIKLGATSFDIAQSFQGMDLLKSISPIANAMEGTLNANIDLAGNLNNDFTPNLNSVSGDALAQLLAAKLNPEKTKALSLLDSKLPFLNLNNFDLSDITTKLSFKNGRVEVAPFQVKYKDVGIQIGGSHGFDQTMDYNVTFDVPAKYLGNEVSGLLAKLSSKDQNITVPVTANITGNMSSPSVKTDMSSSVAKLSQKLMEKQKNDLVNNTLGNLLGNGKKDAKSKDKTVKKVSDVLGGLFGKKKKKEEKKK